MRQAGWISLLLCTGLVLATANASGQALRFEEIGKIQGPANFIRVEGRYLYTAADKVLAVFDVSNPQSPSRVGDYAFPDRILGFRPLGRFVYVAANLYGLGILEISDAGTPMLRGNYKTPGSAKNVAVSGGIAVIADQVAGLDFVDVKDPAKPMPIGSVYLDGFASDVASAGSYAYAVDRPNGFYVADMSKPKLEEPISSLRSSVSMNGNFQLEVVQDAAGRLVTAVRSPRLLLYDISNPATPVERGPFLTPGGGQRLAVRGTMVYVADGPAGLQVIDLSAPAAPRIVGTYQTTGPAFDVAVSETLVFVVIPGTGVVVLRQASN
jgi:hypothetical protein